MNNKKQNSVEWAIQQISKVALDCRNGLSDKAFHVRKEEILEQAKAMHKEEQENTWEIAWDESSKFDYCKNKYNGGFQQYYNETFGGNNE